MNRQNRVEYTYGRQRKKHPFLLLLILLAAAAAALLVHFKVIPLKQSAFFDKAVLQESESSGQDQNTKISDDTEEALEAMATQNPKAEPILQNPERYPERLLESLVRNPELLDFTLDYPQKKGTSGGSIDLSCKYQKGQIPLFMQWDEDWGYAPYGKGLIALDGCGPTCLSMVAVGLTGNSSLNPKEVAGFSEKNGYLDAKTSSTLWTLMSQGAKDLGLSSREIPLDENRMAQELSQGHPIICSLRPGDFTTVGHFIVLYGYENGNFLVKDPNSKSRSEKAWSYGTLKPQIRNLWAFSV
nr:C39 family peptidase [uncultured Caproiciproducens sp.]